MLMRLSIGSMRFLEFLDDSENLERWLAAS
jgi:hypothetical protein